MEYSGMRYAAFMLAEYIAMVGIAALVTTLFLGGYHVPWLHAEGFQIFGWFMAVPVWLVSALQVLAFVGKIIFFCWLIIIIRWTIPRFRFDQIMELGWKKLLPLSLANIVVTVQYPEEKRRVSARYRGRHRLTVREDGFIKCVACYMCEEICPAHCIHIESGEVEDKSVEKYPVVFDIDELRCVFCGLCVEACPKDAIRMDTGIISLAHGSRDAFDYTRDMLKDAYHENEKTKFRSIPSPLTEEEALPHSVGRLSES